jgi:hypothetical protein
MKNTIKKYVFWLLASAVALVLFAPFFLLKGFVFMMIWNWFIPHTFALPTISTAKAMGIIVVWAVLNGKMVIDEQSSQRPLEESIEFVKTMLGNFMVMSGFALCIGWLVKHWV